MTRRIYSDIKKGDNKNLYAYYAVFRIYLHVLLEQRRWHLLLQVLHALYRALEKDFDTRHHL